MIVLSVAIVACIIFGLGTIAGLCFALYLMRDKPEPRHFFDIPDYPPNDWGGDRQTDNARNREPHR